MADPATASMTDPTPVVQSRAQRLITRVTAHCHAHPMRADALLAASLATLSIVGVLTIEPDGSERAADVWGVLLAGAIHLPLAFRRVHPIAVLGAVAVPTWVFWTLDYSTVFDGGLLVALYSVMSHVEDRKLAWRTAGTVAVISVAWILVGMISDEDDVGIAVVLGAGAMVAIAVVLGDNMRHRRQQQAALEARAARAERDAAEQARRAAVEERTRIARELHDVVAHSMSVMVVQAGAARRVLGTDPGRADEALAAIQDTGRSSLDDMRRVLGILRQPDEQRELAPQPTLADLDSIVDSCRDAGLDVALEIDGAEQCVPAAVELAAFRIVQEALTNVVKHADARRVTVTLHRRPDAIGVEVVDDGVAKPGAPSAGGGNGIVGMRERVDLFGGELVTERITTGGFRVAATLPMEPPVERTGVRTVEASP